MIRSFVTTSARFSIKYENASDYYGTEIRCYHRDDRLPVAVSKFASKLKDSLSSRFPKLALLEAMSIFSSDTFPNSVNAGWLVVLGLAPFETVF